jgi:proline dehydrogenase
MGLEQGAHVFHENLVDVLDTAARLGNEVEIDMEDAGTTESTLAVVHQLLGKSKNLRVALQTYLYRTTDDLKKLVEAGSSVRLVKGAYDESAEVAWKNKKDVDESYARLVEQCFTPTARASGFYPAFATHDHVLIQKALSEASIKRFSKDRFEFQMLLGVRRTLQRDLVSKGCNVRVYVPFGALWYPYFMRRLAERPANVLLLIRTMLSG